MTIAAGKPFTKGEALRMYRNPGGVIQDLRCFAKALHLSCADVLFQLVSPAPNRHSRTLETPLFQFFGNGCVSAEAAFGQFFSQPKTGFQGERVDS